MNELDNIFDDIRIVYEKMAWLNGEKMKKALKGYSASEVHWLEFIGNTSDVNVTKLSDNFFMTRGAMSKATKKLMTKGVIRSFRKETNKKEIYFELTEEGKRIYDIHKKLHQEFKERDKAVFDTIKPEMLKELSQFLNMYDQHLSEMIDKQNLKQQ